MRPQLAQLCRLWERFFPCRGFELWEAPYDRRVFFMVAGRLTRQEALDAAALLEAAGPRPPAVLVVDRRDTPDYEAPPAGSPPERPPRARATADAAAAGAGRPGPPGCRPRSRWCPSGHVVAPRGAPGSHSRTRPSAREESSRAVPPPAPSALGDWAGQDRLGPRRQRELTSHVLSSRHDRRYRARLRRREEYGRACSGLGRSRSDPDSRARPRPLACGSRRPGREHGHPRPGGEQGAGRACGRGPILPRRPLRRPQPPRARPGQGGGPCSVLLPVGRVCTG
jgi:hypothetical protein